MSRFVDDDWSVFRLADAPAPPAMTLSTWLRRERLLNASDEERLERWVEWNRSNSPTPALLQSIERSGNADWISAASRTSATSALLLTPARPDPLLIGAPSFDDAQLRWQTDSTRQSPSGVLSLVVDGAERWRLEDVLPAALLAWLASNWTVLSVQDQLPLSVLDSRWHQRASASFPPGLVGLREKLFRRQRDFQQITKPHEDNPFVVWREGLVAQLRTGTDSFAAPWEAIEAQLTTIGRQIIEGATPVPVEIVEQWRTRNVVDAAEALTAAGLESDEFPVAVAVLETELSDVHTSIEENELLAAARLSSRLTTREVADVLDALISVDKGGLDELEQATDGLLPPNEALDGLAPWDQGHTVALHVRSALGLDLGDPFQPEAWLDASGVEVQLTEFKSTRVDAVSCWGARRGPTVIVNRRGIHSRSQGGRRVTLAHEIGHLIMDRHAALPAAEVLSGEIRNSVEQRAGSFAAEMMLPRAYTALMFKDAPTLAVARELIAELTERFGVSEEIVAWQTRNSGVRLSTAAYNHLRSKVVDKAAFDRPVSSTLAMH